MWTLTVYLFIYLFIYLGMLNEELTSLKDREIIRSLKDKMQEVSDIMDLDEQYPVEDGSADPDSRG